MKKILALFIALVLMISLFSCGPSKDKDDGLTPDNSDIEDTDTGENGGDKAPENDTDRTEPDGEDGSNENIGGDNEGDGSSDGEEEDGNGSGSGSSDDNAENDSSDNKEDDEDDSSDDSGSSDVGDKTVDFPIDEF